MRYVDWYLVRDTLQQGYTLGEIRYNHPDSQRVCYTAECEDRFIEGKGRFNVDTAVPVGRYRITVFQSRLHGQCILLNAVDGFKGVVIADKPPREGCIVVGDERTLEGVSICKPPLLRLITELRYKTMKDIPVYLNVIRL